MTNRSLQPEPHELLESSTCRPTPRILIAHDGSEDAQRAIAAAGERFPGAPAVVLTVWEPLVVEAVRLA